MGTIKLFKKFIEESIWSDMQDRSAGDTVRKEEKTQSAKMDFFYKNNEKIIKNICDY